MKEGHSIQHGPPLSQAGVVQLLLTYTSICPLQSSLYSLRRFIGELDAGLKITHKNSGSMLAIVCEHIKVSFRGEFFADATKILWN